MVGESLYNGWFHAIDLQHDPKTLLESTTKNSKINQEKGQVGYR